MKPQTQEILIHLEKHGSITPIQAEAVYKCRSLTSRIAELRKSGFAISRLLKKDATGQRYATYTLATRPTGIAPVLQSLDPGPTKTPSRPLADKFYPFPTGARLTSAPSARSLT